MEEGLGRVEDPALGPAELAAPGAGWTCPAQGLARQLHPVADPQDRDAQLEEPGVAVRRARLVDARRPAREDQRQRVQLADPLERDVVPHDPREGVPLADPPGDELDVLRAEVEDQDGPLGSRAFHERRTSMSQTLTLGTSRDDISRLPAGPSLLRVAKPRIAVRSGFDSPRPNSPMAASSQSWLFVNLRSGGGNPERQGARLDAKSNTAWG